MPKEDQVLASNVGKTMNFILNMEIFEVDLRYWVDRQVNKWDFKVCVNFSH